MPTNRSTLGRCPACHTVIPAGKLLIKYEKGDSQEVYAECPECEVPVRPG
ncbi:DUF7837 family putative zinc-binding protein [Halopenitus persicus]